MYSKKICRFAFRLAEQGYKAKDVLSEIQKKFSEEDKLPPIRTVQIWVRTARQKITDYWEFSLDNPPEENRAVLSCLEYLYKSDYLSKRKKPKIPFDLAQIIAKIYQICPDIPPQLLYHAAREEWVGETWHLETFLALAPWRSEDNCASYAAWLRVFDDDINQIVSWLAEKYPSVVW